jgi:hypothetical protein
MKKEKKAIEFSLKRTMREEKRREETVRESEKKD